MYERRPPGFRFWWSDAVVLGVGAAFCALFWRPLGPAIWPVPFALVHFFLFCNVFRVRRSHELTWTGLLLVNVAAWWFAGRLGWLPVLISQTPITLGVILLEIRSPDYHGIFFGSRRPPGSSGRAPLDAPGDGVENGEGKETDA